MMKFFVIAVCLAVAYGRDSITVDPDKAGGGGSKGPDLSGTDLLTTYCEAQRKECPGADLEAAKFAPTPRQCQIRCTYNLKCLTAYFDGRKYCHLRANRCSAGQLKSSAGSDYYRLKKGESCPSGRELYKEKTVPMSNTFCALKDKTCKGHNLYEKPQNIRPFTKCLEKCAKITSCASVDFVNNKCIPKDHACSDDELVHTPGAINVVRLVEGVSECDPSRKIECGDHSHVNAEGTDCDCDDGYSETAGKCVKNSVKCGDNAYEDGGSCRCYSGYEKVNDKCVERCGANSKRVGDSCSCIAGYEKVGSTCVAGCGANAKRVGDSCNCVSGYEMVNGQCLQACGSNSRRDGNSCTCLSGYEQVNGQCLVSCGPNGKRAGTSCSCNPGFAWKDNQCKRSGYSLSGESLYGVCLDRNTRHEYCGVVGDCHAAIHNIRFIARGGEDGCSRECDNECSCRGFRYHVPTGNCFLVSTQCSTMDHTIGTWKFHVKAEPGSVCDQYRYSCKAQPVEYCRRPGDCASFNIRHVPTNRDNCENLCTNECACHAYFHDGGLGCWLKSIACTTRTHAVTAYSYYIKMAKGEDCDWAIEGRCRDTKFKYCYRSGDCVGHNIRAKALGLNDCKRECDRECSCKAFYHAGALGCVLKSIACTKMTHRSPASGYYVKTSEEMGCPSEFGSEVSGYE